MGPDFAPVDVISDDRYIGKRSWQAVWEAIDDKVRKMHPGQSFIYHTGFLAEDRETDDEVDTIATRYCLHGTPPYFAFGHGCFSNGTGLGRLTQNKLEDGKYEYKFTRNRRQQSIHNGY